MKNKRFQNLKSEINKDHDSHDMSLRVLFAIILIAIFLGLCGLATLSSVIIPITGGCVIAAFRLFINSRV